MMEDEQIELEINLEKETEKTKEESKMIEIEHIKRVPVCDD